VPEKPVIMGVDETPSSLTSMSGLPKDLCTVKVANGKECAPT
jgi:hypothetical protein